MLHHPPSVMDKMDHPFRQVKSCTMLFLHKTSILATASTILHKFIDVLEDPSIIKLAPADANRTISKVVLI